MNPPNPDIAYTMTNWYNPKTVRFAEEAGLNLIWITFSVGFSNETEAAHQAEVWKYIAECHRQGIHVMAYESIANMFWEDMFQAVPESKAWIALGKDGKPVPYSAGTYAKMGRITRYMADLSNPAWRAYLMKRIDLPVDSGAAGLMYDNNSGDTLFELYPQLFSRATGKKKDFLLMANFHSVTYVLNRLINCITTEDGVEPGLHSPSSEGYADLKQYYPYLVNIGLIVEGGSARRLMTGDSGAIETWRAIGKYNRFFTEHEKLYVGAGSRAPLAIILDDRSDGVPLLDGLAARRVLFEAIYERDVTPEALPGSKRSPC